MGWEDHLHDLFEDLEHQARALTDAEREPELADRSRAEYRQVTLASRLMASIGREVALRLVGTGPVAGRLDRVGSGWCLVRGSGQDWLVVLGAVQSVAGAGDRSVPEVAWPRTATLGLAAPLRRLGETEQRCVLHLLDGERLEGTLERVGADFVEARDVTARLALVAFGSLVAVQSRD